MPRGSHGPAASRAHGPRLLVELVLVLLTGPQVYSVTVSAGAQLTETLGGLRLRLARESTGPCLLHSGSVRTQWQRASLPVPVTRTRTRRPG
jgi:hypothetical protein